MNLTNHTIKVAPEFLDIHTLHRRDKDTRSICLGNPTLLHILQREVLTCSRSQIILIFLLIGVGIDLIKHQIYRLIARTDILQGLLHHIYLLLEIGV